ncbi:hypothetical protein C477_10578 [Haloterrigena salina JCM 13891]|uniref:Uncharacterized protein n=1 Tax=Haloterrigena salina JCM 13891 TaxID=1227488 RepID=M0C5P3_9EURY|nr:hypothetical protein [Haloterrigena salina]ELZ18505.1 hypothetical protein C477_10578 [Haloterrigena salina JCM 13891]
MSTDLVRFESVAARDVALIVLEELAQAAPVRAWLFEAIGLEADSATILEASDSLGGPESPEFDATRRWSALEIGLETADERVRLVLTIGTGPAVDTDADALESIRTRRDRALDGDWDDCRLVSIAPKSALETGTTDTEPPTDATISLESLRDRFAARDGDRDEYRAALVQAAIDRGRRRASAGPPSIVAEYRALVREREPAFDLEAENEGADTVADDDTAVAIDAPPLADDHRLVHALSAGSVDLRIPGVAAHLRAFAARYATAIPPATDLLTDGDALVLRLSVPAIGSGSSADDDALDGDATAIDEAAVDETLTAIRDLLTVAKRVDDRSS